MTRGLTDMMLFSKDDVEAGFKALLLSDPGNEQKNLDKLIADIMEYLALIAPRSEPEFV